ncbi:MAG TPA: hypothetical protein VIF12_07235, partial [Micavibrio sp.]
VMHRDTWLANPQCQINWWMPLHDVCDTDSFGFFPAYFDTPVENSSGGFNYDEWMEKVGFNNISANAAQAAQYPIVLKDDCGLNQASRFTCRKGEVILFSGAHLHSTMPNTSGQTRFSVDFRIAHMGDHESGKGAPNIDNRSTGEFIRDFILPR